jgi:Uma2 family endonuclease
MIVRNKAISRRNDALPALENGAHLDQKTFHKRYEAMPHPKAELIGGIVYVPSPMKLPHARVQRLLTRWLDQYVEATEGTDALAGATDILGPKAEPQPDGLLFILPECGGQTWADKQGYLNGAPEWVGEIGDSTESIDLHSKKRDYEQAGVREYMVAALRQKKVFWFIRDANGFKEMPAGKGGIFRSEAFPGLWLDSNALLRHDRARLLSVLRQGLASKEHTAFVTGLASRKTNSQ